MKTISFVVPQVKARRHRALFDEDLPFRPRSEKPKNTYKRKTKHRNREQFNTW